MADISPVHRTVRRRVRALAAILMLSAAPMALAQTTQLDRAREAEARGELRAAQIELRNAVRAAPALAEARARLAEVSLDLGELDVAEREARAALERGYSRAEGTRLLLRVLLTQRKADDLLREFPLTEAGVPPAVAAQVAAARAQAQLILGRPDEAAQSVAAARRLGPNAPEPLVAAADLAIAQNNATQAEVEIDRALALDPTNRDALVRKAALQLQRGDADGAIDSFTRVIAMRPGDTQARLGRAELKMRRGDTRAATEDVEAALRATPNNAAAVYMRAVLQVTAQDWQRADESLQRIMPVLSNFPDGFLVLAMAKRGLGQTAQAEDAAQRHVARRPEDPRGARLLASMALEAGRPADAVAVLARLNDRGAADAESLDLLATAYIASRRPADAVRTLQAAARLQPANANIQLRLAVSSFVAGDAATAVEAARAALRLASDRVEARDILAAALLAQGQVAEAEAEMQRLGAGWQSREIPATVQATLQLLRYDLAAARTSFSNVLRNHPNAVNARLGLAQIVAFEGNAAEQRRLLGEVLRIDPENAEALRRIAALSVVAGEIGTEARAVMAAAQAAAPNSPALAMTYAAVLIRTGAAARASEILANDALQGQVPGNTLALMRAEAHAAANQWAEAEAAARTALAEDPSSVAARRLLAIVLLRRGDARGAEALVNEGLRANRGDATLQQTLLGLVNQAQGADAALALADRLAADPAARPASSQLRGDMLLQLQRPEDAARAYAAAYAETPSRVLAMRLAATLTRLGRAQEAAAALDAWLAREPDDAEVLGLRAQNDLVAGQPAAAERRLSRVLELRPTDAVALNNLAWMLAERGQGNDLARARDLAERAYVLRPSAESADTLGWVLVKSGEPARAVSLLRAAAGGAGTPQLAGGIGYRLAYALNASGNQAEAREIVRRVLALEAQFPERADAERLRATLGGG